MRTRISKIVILFFVILSSISNVIAKDFELMYVYRCKVMVGDSLCYLVRKDRPYRGNNKNWEPFCGEFKNLFFSDGYSGFRICPIMVNKYDVNADTIYVIKMIGCDDSGLTIKCDCDKFRKEYEEKKNVEKCDCPVIEESEYRWR